MRVVNMKYNNPVNGVNVGRPTIWGNDWSNLSWGKGVHKNLSSAREAVFHYTDWLINGMDERAEELRRRLFAGALVGRTLKCWCVNPDGTGSCHAKILAEISDQVDSGMTPDQITRHWQLKLEERRDHYGDRCRCDLHAF
jgi:hypothetical protein